MGNKITKNQQDILSPSYIYDFGATVWRIRLDTATGRLALEVRDGDVLLAQFYTLDTHTFTLQQLQLPHRQGWWQGLEDTQEGLVYLHGYGDRKLGQHKRITALGVTGTPHWEEPELAFYGIGPAGMYAHTVASPEDGFLVLDLHTGQQKATGIRQEEAAEAVAAFNSVRYRDCVYPVFYQEGEGYFSTVRDFLEEQTGVVAVQAMEYAETDSYIVVSFYSTDAEKKLINELAVFDPEGHLCLQQTLAGGLSGPGSDTFFIFRDYLFFIQNKTVLQVFSLRAS